MMRLFSQWLACGLVYTTFAAAAPAAEPSISLELVFEGGVSLDANREWLESLKDLGFRDLRARGGSKESPEVKRGGSDDYPSYSVRAVIGPDNSMSVPGGKFRLGDKNGIRNWMAKLRDGGEEGLTAKKGKFGLTPPQLVSVHDDLKRRVSFSTKGRPAGELIKAIAAQLELETAVAESANAAVDAKEEFADELEGFSYGTALAAVLRPQGCTFSPEKKLGEKLRYVIADSSELTEPWPVGWEPAKRPVDTAPEFFKQVPFEVADFALLEAIGAISKRSNLPLVFDYNSMARHRIDPAAVKVTAPKGKATYYSLMSRLLLQAKLKFELRIDEAEHPFLWITTTAR